MLVNQILSMKASGDIYTVAPDVTVADAAKLLSDKRIGAIVVSDDGKVPLGILSERDIVRELGRRGAAVLDQPISDLMTRKLMTCSTGEDALEILNRMTQGYSATVRRTLRRPFLVLLVLAGISWGAADLFGRMTTTFIPTEDQGVLQSRITLTEGSTAQQTAAVVQEIEEYMLNDEKAAVESVFVAMGFGYGGTAQNRAQIFVKLRDFDQRSDAELSARAVAQRANRHFSDHRAGRIFFMQPPAIPRLGNSSGFTMYIMDQSAGGMQALAEAADQLELTAGDDDDVQNVTGNFDIPEDVAAQL